MSDNSFNFDYPEKLIEFVKTTKPYQVLYGGRSSAKTYTALLKLMARALSYAEPKIILCTRETQKSIETSTYLDLKLIIEKYNLHEFFIIKHDKIVTYNGTEFLFKGLVRDINSIKSMPNIAACLVEEAETIGRRLWEVLDPTLRNKGVELIICFNPKDLQGYTYQEFVVSNHYGDDIYRQEINYPDNPFNSPDILKKIKRMREHDYARYEHIYLGKVLDMSEDVIFKGRFKILDMEVEHNTQYWRYQGQRVVMLNGLDFGFYPDPAAFIELCFLDEDTIYFNREIYLNKLLPAKYIQTIKENMPEAINELWSADNARNDSIAQLKHDGLNCEAAGKGKGSIESGIEYLQGKNLIVHPRCTNLIYELYNYKHKIDKNSGKITTEIIDANNHLIDATRYALHRQIQAMHNTGLNFTQEDLAYFSQPQDY